jgi:hypothetical protein
MLAHANIEGFSRSLARQLANTGIGELNRQRMSLGSQQREFSLKVAKLIVWIYQNGYEVSLGDAFRDARVHGKFGEKGSYASAKSFHKKKLAIDLNLFHNGKYLSSTADHKPIGEKWERMGGTWGGRFAKKDGNHYSWGEAR